jgi:hypothetical protein
MGTEYLSFIFEPRNKGLYRGLPNTTQNQAWLLKWRYKDSVQVQTAIKPDKGRFRLCSDRRWSRQRVKELNDAQRSLTLLNVGRASG